MNETRNECGKKVWAFAAGRIPFQSNGPEPTFTSHDKVAVLNTSDKDTELLISIYYENSEPIAEHSITVKARRIRKIRFNDLIDPLPIPLDTPFGFVLRSEVKVIVQFSRMITAHPTIAAFCTTAYHQNANTHE